jgi:hypothetical protein
MCLRLAWLRSTLPVAVTLKRFATAFFVLRLAIGFGIKSPQSKLPCRVGNKNLPLWGSVMPEREPRAKVREGEMRIGEARFETSDCKIETPRFASFPSRTSGVTLREKCWAHDSNTKLQRYNPEATSSSRSTWVPKIRSTMSRSRRRTNGNASSKSKIGE